MKKKVFLKILLLIILLFCLTGCGNTEIKENNNTQNNQQETNQDYTAKQSSNTNLTVEKFKEVMKRHGLQVVSKDDSDSSIVKTKHNVDDKENITRYSLEEFRDEEMAIRYWNDFVKTRYENSVIEVIKYETNEHTAESEKLITNGTYIDFRKNDIILKVYISKDAGEKGVSTAKSLLAELGFYESSNTET